MFCKSKLNPCWATSYQQAYTIPTMRLVNIKINMAHIYYHPRAGTATADCMFSESTLILCSVIITSLALIMSLKNMDM